MVVDEADLMAVIFTVAPKKYQNVLASVQIEKGNSLSLEDLEAAMNQVFRQENAVKQKAEDRASEIALATVGGDTRKCYNCQEIGHISKDCPKKKRANVSGNSGKKCGRCGKPHNTKDCWQDPKNEEKRPKWYKSAKAGEVGAVSADEGTGKGIELMLAGISFPTTIKILEDPNIWIADSATTVHNTPHATGVLGKKAENGEGKWAGRKCKHRRRTSRNDVQQRRSTSWPIKTWKS